MIIHDHACSRLTPQPRHPLYLSSPNQSITTTTQPNTITSENKFVTQIREPLTKMTYI